MAERASELNEYESTYPNDTLNRTGGPDADDEMMDPLDETPTGTVVVETDETFADEFDPSATEAEIMETRARMGATIDEIQERLRPQTLADQAKDAISQVGAHAKDTFTDVAQTAAKNVTDQAKGMYHGVVDPVAEKVGDVVGSAKGTAMSTVRVVRDNPIPLVLASIGLIWLIRNMMTAGGQQPSSDYNPTIFTPAAAEGSEEPSMIDQAGDAASQAKDQAGRFVGKMQDKASDAIGRAQDKLGEVTDKSRQAMGAMSDKARQTVRGGADTVQRMHQENPLMLGAVALFTGAVIGLLLPSTDRENRLFGGTRDRMMDRMGDKAQEIKGKVGTVAKKAVSSAKDTLKQEAQNEGLMNAEAGDSTSTAQEGAQSGVESPLPGGADQAPVNQVSGFA